MVDEGNIALRPAVELSYITKEIQEDIFNCIDMEQCTPTHAQAIRMRKMAAESKLTPGSIEARIVFRGDRIAKLFPKDLPLSKREDFVAAAMEHYNRFLQRKAKDQER